MKRSTQLPSDDLMCVRRDLLTCGICSELPDQTLVLPCGHTLCASCAQQTLNKSTTQLPNVPEHHETESTASSSSPSVQDTKWCPFCFKAHSLSDVVANRQLNEIVQNLETLSDAMEQNKENQPTKKPSKRKLLMRKDKVVLSRRLQSANGVHADMAYDMRNRLREITDLREQLSKRDATIKRLNRQVQNHTSRVEDLETLLRQQAEQMSAVKDDYRAKERDWKRELTGAKRDANKEASSTDRKDLQIQLLTRDLEKARQQCETLKNELLNKNEDMSKLKLESQQKDVKLESVQLELNAVERASQLSRARSDALTPISDYSCNLTVVQQSLQAKEKEAKQLRKQLNDYKTECTRLNETLEENKDIVEEKDDQINVITFEMQRAQQQVKALRVRQWRMTTSLAKKDVMINSQLEILDDLKGVIASQTEQIDDLSLENVKLEQQLSNNEEQVQHLKISSEEKELALSSSQARLQKLKAKHKRSVAFLDELQQQSSNAQDHNLELAYKRVCRQLRQKDDIEQRAQIQIKALKSDLQRSQETCVKLRRRLSVSARKHKQLVAKQSDVKHQKADNDTQIELATLRSQLNEKDIQLKLLQEQHSSGNNDDDDDNTGQMAVHLAEQQHKTEMAQLASAHERENDALHNELNNTNNELTSLKEQLKSKEHEIAAIQLLLQECQAQMERFADENDPENERPSTNHTTNTTTTAKLQQNGHVVGLEPPSPVHSGFFPIVTESPLVTRDI